ncbi:unnamed protein product [Cladocopium goreaui]|uniref:Uncharacterized protein n=1 Tax=Cladocopium goreaui TaxID=2562237 RepID=A0A9P1BZP8_9DINO|nr:unnamed protein product [Cladocopium goreaui]
MIHAGDAANSMLWVLASAQSLGNLLLPPLAVTALAVSACAGLGLSFWPSVAFLVVHQCHGVSCRLVGAVSPGWWPRYVLSHPC